jgi:hypothetical protein
MGWTVYTLIETVNNSYFGIRTSQKLQHVVGFAAVAKATKLVCKIIKIALSRY